MGRSEPMRDHEPLRRAILASLVALASGLLACAVASAFVHTEAFNGPLAHLGIFPAPLRLPFVVICTLAVAAGAACASLRSARRFAPPLAAEWAMGPQDELWPY